MKKLKFKFMIHPLFIIFACILIYLNYFAMLLSYIITIILHELAHSIVANKLGYKLNIINLMPHGASLSGENRFFSAKDEILVALAGPALNLILAIFGCAIWWLFPNTYFYTQTFVYANIITAVINCLPVFPLDGGRVLLALLSKNYTKTKAIKKVRLLGIITSCLLLLSFVITTFFIPNYTLLIFGSFLFITAIIEDKKSYYTHIGIFQSKALYLNKGLKIRKLAVLDTMPLYKLLTSITPDSLTEFTVLNKDYKIIGKITEKQLENFIQIYPANTCLNVILT